MSEFIKLLSERNADFISHFSSESAIGLYGTFYDQRRHRDGRKECVVISFDPPVGHPPIVFNWNSSDVWFLNDPSLDGQVFDKLDALLKNSAHQKVIFVERESPAHHRKIQRFIRNYHRSTKKKVSERPSFILGEYRGPFAKIKLSEFREENHDTLLA